MMNKKMLYVYNVICIMDNFLEFHDANQKYSMSTNFISLMYYHSSKTY